VDPAFPPVDPKGCLNCSISFLPKRKTNVYCCRSCQVGHLRKSKKIKDRVRQGVFCQCLHCNAEFYVPQYRSNTAKYCSRKCSALDKPELAEKARKESPIIKRSLALREQGCEARTYKTIYVKGVQVREHRWIMEQSLGRKLESWEHVHHVDGNHLNNDIQNLEVLSNADHQRKELSPWMDNNNL
jgi:hypothetical protein